MSSPSRNQYVPISSPTRATLQETLETLGMSQVELAERTGRPTKTISEIIKPRPPSPPNRLQFEKVLGVPARFWMNLERNYREWLAAPRNARVWNPSALDG